MGSNREPEKITWDGESRIIKGNQSEIFAYFNLSPVWKIAKYWSRR